MKYLNRYSILFLKFTLILIGIFVFAVLLIEPHFEGRNANSTIFQIYFNDPFLAYVYVSSVPFYLLLFQFLKVLRFIEKDSFNLDNSKKALDKIKLYSLIMTGSVFGGLVWLSLSESDDKPPLLLISFVAIFICFNLFAAAELFTKLLRSNTQV